MLKALLALISLQIIGDVIASNFGIPVPGAVIGMVMLVLILALKGKEPEYLENASKHLFPFLPLLLIPASVGVINYLDVLEKEWIALVVSLVLSLIVGIVFTALMFIRLKKLVLKNPLNVDKK